MNYSNIKPEQMTLEIDTVFLKVFYIPFSYGNVFFLFLCFVNTLSTLHQLIHCNFFHFRSLDNIVECILPPDYADSTMHVVVVWLFFLVLRRIG